MRRNTDGHRYKKMHKRCTKKMHRDAQRCTYMYKTDAEIGWDGMGME